MTASLFASAERRTIDMGDGLRVTVIERFLDAETSATLFGALDTLPFERRMIRMFGREIPEPRTTYACGDRYTYSGIQHEARTVPWPVQMVIDRAEHEIGERFNQGLVTRYANGNEAIGLHSDDEPELGVDPVVASVSFGATRRFKMRGPAAVRAVEIALTDGMLLVMGAGVQRRWKHEIPKQVSAGPRISVTLRRIVR